MDTQAKPGKLVDGLEGIVVAETRSSDVDGQRGKLFIAGYDVEELAPRLTFEECYGLLLSGNLPTGEQRERIRQRLAGARAIAFRELGNLGSALSRRDGMDALRASMAQLEASQTGERTADEITGAVAVFAAAWNRLRQGLSPIEPSPELSHSEDYLRMSSGRGSDAAHARALDSYLVTISDHGMNASTFTARVVASTASDPVSCVVAAIGALKGPLHGGAPGPVLEMLDRIASPPAAADWLEAELAAGRRIMGMGHRIYRVRDPRAAVMEGALARLTESGVVSPRLELARAVEKAAEGILRRKYPNRPLHANVEFYTAVLLDAIGLDRELFSTTFAVGRVVGWLAHVAEQQQRRRIIRPDSIFVGEKRTLG